MELLSAFLFFNIGAPELFIIVLVVIIFFGSKKIPELMRGLGKGMREFKNATGEIQHENRKSANSIENELKNTAPPPKAGATPKEEDKSSQEEETNK